jgi:Cys/Met metabolism PLP-dependent enzyme
MTGAGSSGGLERGNDVWRDDLGDLLEFLETELSDASDIGADVAATVAATRGLAACLPNKGFHEAYNAYAGLGSAKAAALNAVAEVASSYRSMDDFWADAAAQEEGRSRRGYWDSYEHGRRRQLEKILAEAYGAQGCVLVNTGMSALDVALGAFGLGPGNAVLAHQRAYFETTEYLDAVLAPRGIAVVRTDFTDRAALAGAAADPRVRVALVETALNGVPASVPYDLASVLDAGLPVIIDNSLLSHAARLFDVFPNGRLLVIESAIKYLTSSCCAGVVYGRGADLVAVRDYARRVGQQLQERAFNHLHVGELTHAARRVARHGASQAAFRAALDPAPWSWIHDVRDAAAGCADPLAETVQRVGPGSLLFARLRCDDDVVAINHRSVLAGWCDRARGEGIPLSLRAGFGWPQTSARSYESTRLNQPDAPVYLRISVGLEPLGTVVRLAELLGQAAKEVSPP